LFPSFSFSAFFAKAANRSCFTFALKYVCTPVSKEKQRRNKNAYAEDELNGVEEGHPQLEAVISMSKFRLAELTSTGMNFWAIVKAMGEVIQVMRITEKNPA
jgi:hypothetical protein